MDDAPTVRRRASASAPDEAGSPSSSPGLVPVLRPDGEQLSPSQGLQVVLQDKDNAGVLSQFILFSIAVACLPVGVFFFVRRGLSPAPDDAGAPAWLVSKVVAAAPGLFTPSRVPSVVAALTAVLAVNVVTGAFVLRALVEDARLVAAVGGAPPAPAITSTAAAPGPPSADVAGSRPKTT